jgi:hypothetical protein
MYLTHPHTYKESKRNNIYFGEMEQCPYQSHNTNGGPHAIHGYRTESPDVINNLPTINCKSWSTDPEAVAINTFLANTNKVLKFISPF